MKHRLATTVVALTLLLLPQAAGATEPAPPPNAFMRVQVAVSESVPRNTAPGWLSVASFTLAGAAFVLALVAVCRQNRLVR